MFKTALFSADEHYPYHDPKVLDIKRQIAKDLQPDYLVFTGDFVNADGISKFTHKNWEDGYWETLDELQGFRDDYYRPLLADCGPDTDVLMCKGNHDGQRFDTLFEKLIEKAHPKKYKYYREMADFQKYFTEAKIKEYNQCHKIGKLNITHGEYHNQHHTQKHALAYGGNILYGHLHTHDSKTVHTKSDNNVKIGYSIPCSCKLGYKYMKNRASSWVQGFAVGYFMPNGNHHIYMVNIINGKTIFNGKIYE